MSHIEGHWQSDGYTLSVGAARAIKSFGFIRPLNSSFEILCINNRRTEFREEFQEKEKIGFHIFTIPFTDENGEVEHELPIAYDIVDYQLHLNAEASFIEQIENNPDLKQFKNGRKKMEEFGPAEIKLARQKSQANVSLDFLKIWDQTADYLDSKESKRLKGKDPLEWIKEAATKKNLLAIDDYCLKQDKGTIGSEKGTIVLKKQLF